MKTTIAKSCCIKVLKFCYTIFIVTAHPIRNLEHFYFRISFETNEFHTVIQWLRYILPFIKFVWDKIWGNFFWKKETKFCCKNIKNDFQYDLLHSTYIILSLDYQFRKEVFLKEVCKTYRSATVRTTTTLLLCACYAATMSLQRQKFL